MRVVSPGHAATRRLSKGGGRGAGYAWGGPLELTSSSPIGGLNVSQAPYSAGSGRIHEADAGKKCDVSARLHPPCPHVSRISALLCLLAIAVAQVPLLACASDCQDVIVSAGGAHSCHKTERHTVVSALAHRTAHHHVADQHVADRHVEDGCCGHSHGPIEQSPVQKSPVQKSPVEQGPAPAESHGVHEVIQTLIVSCGFRADLPAHTYAGVVVARNVTTAESTTVQAVLAAAHLAEPDPVPVPPPASVQLLL